MSLLADRLGRLATANSQGLLSDDEYRMLRQSLFEQSVQSEGRPVSYTPPDSTIIVPLKKQPLTKSSRLGVDTLFRHVTGSPNSQEVTSKWRFLSRKSKKPATSIDTGSFAQDAGSAAAIRKEITSLEAEASRLADEFDRFEMSILSSQNVQSVLGSRTGRDDHMSIRSNGSVYQKHRDKRLNTWNGAPLFIPDSPNSSSFPASPTQRRPSTRLLFSDSPDSPTSSFSSPSLRHRPSLASIRSATSFTRSPSPGASVSRLKVPLAAFSDSSVHDTDKTRRARQEVQERYQSRIIYLEAKLKSKELHEKLMRKY